MQIRTVTTWLQVSQRNLLEGYKGDQECFWPGGVKPANPDYCIRTIGFHITIQHV